MIAGGFPEVWAARTTRSQVTCNELALNHKDAEDWR
jgi:hypothetical protein